MPISADPTIESDEVEAANESTPLLTAPESAVPSEYQNGGDVPSEANGHSKTKSPGADGQDGSRTEGAPMPYTQVFLLCYASLAEPVAYFAIFPFINEMIERTGHLDEKDVGFWSGMIESLFSLVQMVLMIFYGRAADRLGRKPVLVFSLTGIGLATALFGMSQSLWQMIVTRCLAGVFAGSVVTVRTMLSEVTTQETQGRAFGWYMFVRNNEGGGLANPAEQFPRVFGGVPFWEKYPYALATYVAGGIVLSSALSSLFFIDETLKRKVDGQSKVDPPMSTWQVLKSPGVPIVLYIYGHTMLLALAYTAVSPVFMYTSVKNGGFGFSDQRIALFIALAGAAQALWMLLVFPPLQKRLGTGTVLRACAILWPFFMAMYPVLNEFLRNDWNLAFWIIAPTGLVIGSGVAMAFACVQLCINDISPSATVLGTLNALALTLSSGVRAFAPVVATSIFAAGVKWGFADGHLIWFILIIWAALLNVACYYLPAAAEGNLKKQSSPTTRGDGG
ncbi:hypothetical protein LTR37_016003 [Vermiconidia calcicola]|uniref:Uncharacterized protein n=1 Tax=Vermiconidia calcicola TaxID=1690605 RepID=A0ACC3MQL8_9PEZI|nr:hypothetical protein LTR37_016003 [Vermiconidia calcicola]